MSLVKNRKLFKWENERNYPEPYSGLKEKRIVIDVYDTTGTLQTIPVSIIPGLVRGAAALAYTENGKKHPEAGSCYHLQVAISPNDKGEDEVFVEYIDKDTTTLVECVTYNPVTGVIKGCIYDIVQAVAKAYKFDGTAKDYIPEGAAIWIALIVAHRFDPAFRVVQAACDYVTKDVKKLIDTSLPPTEEEMKMSIVNLSYYFYRALSLTGSTNLKIKDDDNQLKQIKKMELEYGDVGPSSGKELFDGDFIVFQCTKKQKKTKPSKVDFTKYSDYPFEKKLSDFSYTEQLLVPSDDPTFTPSEEFVRVLDYFYDSKDDGKDQIKQILLVGGPGGGKSTIGVMAGHYLGGGRPTLTFTCGSNYTSDELKGMLLPVPKDEVEGLTESEQKLLEAVKTSSQEDMLDNCAKALGYPTIFDCVFDPEGSYEQMSGQKMPEGTTDSDIIRVLTGIILSEQKSLSKKIENQAQKDITYKYMPSGIVEAMTKGYVLVLDELTNMRDPAALSDLHEAFDVASSTRRIGTATGDLFVHPDFRCITTANIGLEGNKRINQATLNRLGQVVISVNELPKDQMMARTKNRTGIKDTKLLSKCFDVYKRLKDGSEELRTPGVISPRDFFVFVKAISRGADIETTIRELLLYKLTQGASKEDEDELMQMIEDLPLLDS